MSTKEEINLAEGLAELMADIAAISPEMKRQIEAATGFDKAQIAKDKIGDMLIQIMHSDSGFRTQHLLYGMIYNTVMTAYTNFDGDRAKARDKLASGIDHVMDLVDAQCRANGTYDMLRKAADAAARGDRAEIRRLNEELNRRKTEQR